MFGITRLRLNVERLCDNGEGTGSCSFEYTMWKKVHGIYFKDFEEHATPIFHKKQCFDSFKASHHQPFLFTVRLGLALSATNCNSIERLFAYL